MSSFGSDEALQHLLNSRRKHQIYGLVKARRHYCRNRQDSVGGTLPHYGAVEIKQVHFAGEHVEGDNEAVRKRPQPQHRNHPQEASEARGRVVLGLADREASG